MVALPTPDTPQRRVFYGSFVHSLSLTSIEYALDGLLGVDEAGVIAFFEKDVKVQDVDRVLKGKGWEGVKVKKMRKGEFIMPGLIDTHTHAPQYPNLGFGQQYELLDWLTHVTFPTESRFASATYAKRSYDGIVQRVLDAGTTTACFYGTMHLTTTLLGDACHKKGQRAFVGKCNMDRNAIPTYQEASAEESMADTRTFISHVRSLVNPTLPTTSDGKLDSSSPPPASAAVTGYSPTSLVQPIVTPRFAISCSDTLMRSLGDLCNEDPTLPIQTHLAENPSEVTFTKELFPFADSYTAVYDHFDLLKENTVLAHCVHLSETEMSLIKSRKSGISHCPASNFNLRSGTSRVGDMLDRGIKVSLGTDVAGGFALGILSSLRQASVVSKTIAFLDRDGHYDSTSSSSRMTPPSAAAPAHSSPDPTTPSGYPANYFSTRHLSIETLFWMATMGGAEVTCLDHRVGNFIVGKEFDALYIETGQRTVEEIEAEEAGEKYTTRPDLNPAMFVEAEDGLEMLVEKFLFTGDDRNIAKVFVRGRIVGGREPRL